jgi:type IV pilus assembly protein PilM
MPRIEAVWGIDVGNCSLKALRCRPGPGPDQVIADAFDYIEYPQILTQPGAENPAQLVADALEQFLSRNDLRGTAVAVSVSGQNGLARFIKLPPVETRKIPDIVHYEARQQIPFDLNDVIWDYQRMGGGLEEEGFVLEAEMGLFAMKRDQVLRALEPFDQAGISVDCVQLAPLALYNFLVFDQLTDLPPADEYDAENPPPSTVILSMGTDASDLVVTNGFRVWQRSIPIGGNHFTKALVKELKLTFAKAEHLKRNAATAPEPKAVFQAMRQVFNELLTEVQRSIGYFTTLDRAAKIQRVLTMGSAMKLPGLRRFLAQGLGLEVEVLESFRGIGGPEVVGAPAFQENHLCFPVSYGLALQGLKKSSIHTNLIPKEIVKDRIIRGKKPWAVAAAAVLLLGCTISLVSYSRALATVAVPKFQDAERKAEQVTKKAKDFQSQAADAKAKMDETDGIGTKVVQNVEGRFRWLELLRAVNACLPRDPEGKVPEDFESRRQLHVRCLNCEPLENVDSWLGIMKQNNWLVGEDAGGAPGSPSPSGESPPASPEPGASSGTPDSGAAAPQGIPSMWLVTLQGYHYHNDRVRFKDDIGAQYIRNTLIKNLRSMDVMLPTGREVILPTGQKVDEKERVTMKQIGISYPVLVDPRRPYEEEIVDPNAVLNLEIAKAEGASASPAGGAMPGASTPGYMGESTGRRRSGGSMPLAMPGAESRSTSRAMPGSMPGSMPSGSGRMPSPGRAGAGSRGTYPGAITPGQATTGTSEELQTTIKVRRFDFTVQFVWKPTSPSERKQKKAEAGEQPGAPGEPAPGAQPAPGAGGQPAPGAQQPGEAAPK